VQVGAERPRRELALVHGQHPGGTIAVRDSAGARIATLPSPSPDAELLAIRPEGT
jgi:hypothetical protein